MTLQTSGAISLSQVQAEYGGSNPISMSEYYRGGANVPTTSGSITREPSSGTYNENTGGGYSWVRIIQSGQNFISWAGTTVVSGTTGNPSSITVGNTTYYKVSQSSINIYTGQFFNFYREINNSTAVNTNVPTSGTI